MPDNADELTLADAHAHVIHRHRLEGRSHAVPVGKALHLGDIRHALVLGLRFGGLAGVCPVGEFQKLFRALLLVEHVRRYVNTLRPETAGKLCYLRHVEGVGFELIHLREDLTRGAVHDDLAVVHDHNSVRLNGFLHVVSYHDDRNALFVERFHRCHDLGAAFGVEHGGGLVEHDAVRLHGENTCDRDSLLLTAGELMRGMFAVLVHIHEAKRHIYALAYLRRIYP